MNTRKEYRQQNGSRAETFCLESRGLVASARERCGAPQGSHVVPVPESELYEEAVKMAADQVAENIELPIHQRELNTTVRRKSA